MFLKWKWFLKRRTFKTTWYKWRTCSRTCYADGHQTDDEESPVPSCLVDEDIEHDQDKPHNPSNQTDRLKGLGSSKPTYQNTGDITGYSALTNHNHLFIIYNILTYVSLPGFRRLQLFDMKVLTVGGCVSAELFFGCLFGVFFWSLLSHSRIFQSYGDSLKNWCNNENIQIASSLKGHTYFFPTKFMYIRIWVLNKGFTQINQLCFNYFCLFY